MTIDSFDDAVGRGTVRTWTGTDGRVQHAAGSAGNYIKPIRLAEDDCPKRTAWLEELSAKYKAKYGRNTPE